MNDQSAGIKRKVEEAKMTFDDLNKRVAIADLIRAHVDPDDAPSVRYLNHQPIRIIPCECNGKIVSVTWTNPDVDNPDASIRFALHLPISRSRWLAEYGPLTPKEHR